MQTWGLLLAAALTFSGCDDSTTTELFAGRVSVGGATFYSFSVVENGTVNTASGSAIHLTATYAPGVYCVRVWDIGNLVAVAAFNVTIAHP